MQWRNHRVHILLRAGAIAVTPLAVDGEAAGRAPAELSHLFLQLWLVFRLLIISIGRSVVSKNAHAIRTRVSFDVCLHLHSRYSCKHKKTL